MTARVGISAPLGRRLAALSAISLLLFGAAGAAAQEDKPSKDEQAVKATKSLDDQKLADYIRANGFTTVLGDIKFGKGGEWAQSRVLQVQFRDIKGNDIGQFREMTTQTVVFPPEYATGKVVYPYEKAK